MCIDIVKAQPKVGEWIPCSERLPEERVNPITNDYYIYPVTCDFDGVKDIRYYRFGKGHWHYGFQIMDESVKALAKQIRKNGKEHCDADID